METLSAFFSGLGRYAVRQFLAAVVALAWLVGGLLCIIVGAILGFLGVAVFSLFLLISPIIGWSLKKSIDGFSAEVEDLVAKAKSKGNVTEFPKKGV